MVELKLTSPLWKQYPGATFDDAPSFNPPPVLAGETFACHVLVRGSGDGWLKHTGHVKLDVEPCDDVKLYRVGTVPVRTAVYPGMKDDNYLSEEAGLYSDVMYPVSENDVFFAPYIGFEMLRVEITPTSHFGEVHTAKFTFVPDDGESDVSITFEFEALDVNTPKSNIFVTQWLHADCIAERYGLEPLSQRHFEYTERAVRCAVDNGINALLTPVFTPPLDTEVGGERMTVQLVGVSKRDGSWSFDYTLLDKWCDMGLRCGVEYFEISHLFTQWGAYHAPKIIADVDGEMIRVFGWETDASSDEYVSFLREFISDFRAHMRSRNLEDRCVFHISDEPSADNSDSYRRAAASVRKELDGCIVADALSDISIYRSGACACPITGTDHAADFLSDIPSGLWIYYCCSQSVGVSNRFISMPLARTRIIGIQMWKYRIGGFLHWGYNFYNSQFSKYRVDPFVCTDGDYFAPAGDAFSVYPGDDGEVLMSLRLRAFREALCDMRMLYALEERVGRDRVLDVIEGNLDYEITFDRYPTGEDYIYDVRRRAADMLRAAKE